MTGAFQLALFGALLLIALLSGLAAIGDLRTGTNRFAHSHHDVRRDQLPLNFWMGVASKGIAAVAALVIAFFVVGWPG